jgi:hypothetical protein
MYIGRDSAVVLFDHLAGYVRAVEDHTKLDSSLYESFIQSLYDKYGHGGGGESWATQLTATAGGDTQAFYLFFKELDTFLASRS